MNSINAYINDDDDDDDDNDNDNNNNNNNNNKSKRATSVGIQRAPLRHSCGFSGDKRVEMLMSTSISHTEMTRLRYLTNKAGHCVNPVKASNTSTVGVIEITYLFSRVFICPAGHDPLTSNLRTNSVCVEYRTAYD